MTNDEYYRLLKITRQRFGILSIKTMKELKLSYLQAAEIAARAMVDCKYTGKSELTIAQWKAIEARLQDGADLISRAVEEKSYKLIRDSHKAILSIDSQYIIDAAKESNLTDKIKTEQLAEFGASINDRLIIDMAKRQGSDGYTFSERVWNGVNKLDLPTGINGDYTFRIKNLIQVGTLQGRDGVKIGLDIMKYVDSGKDAVFKAGRYGKLIPGTAEYKRRIPQEVDWRALRLVRSEQYMSIQAAAIEQAKFNPASSGKVNWVINKASKHACNCPELAAASPYDIDKIPYYPHPSCMCVIEQVLIDHDQFMKDIKNWANGTGEVGYMDKWYKRYIDSSQ
jgi:hypothetical protein